MTTPSPDIESLIAAARERHAMFTATIEDGEWNGIELCRCNQPWPCPDRLLIDGMTAVLELIETHDNFALHGSCTPLGKAARTALGEPNA